MKKNSTFRTLLVAVICLLTSVQVKAQFSASNDQYPTTDYSASAYEFSLSAVAAALDTDTATLATALRTYISAEVPDPILFYAVSGGEDVAWTAANEANAHGFWMDAVGLPVGWGDNARFFASPDIDGAAEDVFAFYCGQMPGTMQAGDVATATLKLKFNGKEASFALTLNVIAKPDFDIPEPMLLSSQLTIVGEQEKVVEQFPRGDYSSDPVRVSVAEALQLLGITNKAGMAENIGKVVYTTWYNTADVEQGGGMKKDSLTNDPTGEGHGFWFRPVQNANGEEDGEVAAAGWGDVDRFYLNNFTYNAETDSLTAVLGQYPGVCKENETYFAYVYIIYGDKAYRIKYTLKLGEKEAGNGLADYTKVGEKTVEVKEEPGTNGNYPFKTVNIDMDEIATALGCEVGNVGWVALDDKDNFASATAGGTGWWLSSAGTVVSWGASSDVYIEEVTANDYSVVRVGNYPDHLSIGDMVDFSVYFVNGEKYFQYNFHVVMVEPEKQEFAFESVATRTFAVQQQLDNGYTMFDLGTISVEDIESLIGTADPVLYGLNIDSVAVVKGDYSNTYSCDPNPGFWLNKEGRVSTWGDANSIMGIVYADGLFRGCQKPNLPTVGDAFTTQLFLVNEETNKMITVNISISFVEVLEQKEVVGQENISLPVTTEGKDIEIDLSKAAEALSVTVDDLLSSSNYYLRGMKNGVYGEAANAENGLAFTADGQFDAYGSIYFSIAKDGDKAMLNIGGNDEVAADYSADAQFCFEVNNKQYVYYVKFLSEALYQDFLQGISSVKAATIDGNIYDLQGRQVKAAKKGLYIINGKVVVIK